MRDKKPAQLTRFAFNDVKNIRWIMDKVTVPLVVKSPANTDI
jgi:hypothetical protein